MAESASLQHTVPVVSALTFCTSLRKRSGLEKVVPMLLKATPKWREARLETHDIAMHVAKSESTPNHGVFLFILLSQVDLGSDQTEHRLNRLAHLTGGTNVAVVFLLGEGGDMSGFMQLQLEMMDKSEMRILPLYALQDLPSTLTAFLYQLGSIVHPSRPYRTVVQDLVSYTAHKPRLTEHELNVLSDITSGFKDLANKATTEEGQALLRAYLDEDSAERVMGFWMSDKKL